MRVWFKRILVVVLIMMMAAPTDALARKKRRVKRGPSAMSAALWNASKNEFVYSKNINHQVYPASTTKVMTALLVLENLDLDQYVTISKNATRPQPTKINVREGEQYKVRDLLYAALLKSANDASVALAEAVAGSHSKFVVMMNRRAAQLGAKHTKFVNAHGLPSDYKQYTTARDMALIFREALKKPFFRQAITYKYRIVYSKDGRRHFLKSHNKGLFLGWKREIYGKTGFTLKAKSCFVGSFYRGKDLYVISVFGCSRRWDDIKFIAERYGKVDL